MLRRRITFGDREAQVEKSWTKTRPMPKRGTNELAKTSMIGPEHRKGFQYRVFCAGANHALRGQGEPATIQKDELPRLPMNIPEERIS